MRISVMNGDLPKFADYYTIYKIFMGVLLWNEMFLIR